MSLADKNQTLDLHRLYVDEIRNGMSAEKVGVAQSDGGGVAQSDGGGGGVARSGPQLRSIGAEERRRGRRKELGNSSSCLSLRFVLPSALSLS